MNSVTIIIVLIPVVSFILGNLIIKQVAELKNRNGLWC
jgi:general stress protein CsbA